MNKSQIEHYFFYLSAIVVIIAGLKMASQAAVIIFLSIFIASILTPLMDYMQKMKIPKFIALVFVLSLVFVLLFGIFYIVNTSLESFIANISFYEERLRSMVLQSLAWLDGLGVHLEPKAILEGLNFGALFNMTASTVGNISVFVSKMLLVVIGVAFLLVESRNFGAKVDIIFKNDERSKKNFELFAHTIQKYFTIKTFTSLFTGALITGTLLAFEIPYPFLWGFLGFMLNFIPVVGSIIASVPALLLALIHQDVSTFAWLALIYVLINNLISNIIEPNIMGDGLGLSPAMIFFSLIFWGWVLGPVGMFLAVPLTMTLKIAFDSNSQTAWIGVLLSNLKKRETKA
ncbi:MAG TPA: AI-2E family transporter [Sulfurovum sp.]|nr:AI-2E family transporter [Sulfurovum sp.]